jgi:hypothetical protein
LRKGSGDVESGRNGDTERGEREKWRLGELGSCIGLASEHYHELEEKLA